MLGKIIFYQDPARAPECQANSNTVSAPWRESLYGRSACIKLKATPGNFRIVRKTKKKIEFKQIAAIKKSSRPKTAG
jgi:hypothetical protein